MRVSRECLDEFGVVFEDQLGYRCGKSPHPSSLREPTFSRKREKEAANDQRGLFLVLL